MTERKRRVEDLLESMGRMVVPVADESEAEREQVIDAVNNRLEMSRSTGSATRARRWLFASAAAVLCLSTGLAFAHFRRAESSVQSASAQATRAVVFKRGDAVHTDTGETRVGSLENGAQVTLGEGTEMTVSALLPGTDELVLDRGRVDLTVPKLHSGQTLSVTTPDSTVTVRGTRFSVEVVIEGSRAITSVEVTQGSVWVRQGDARLVLEAGSHWSSRASQPPATLSAPSERTTPNTPNEAVGPASAPAASSSSGSVRVEASQARTAVVASGTLGASPAPADAHAPPAAEQSTLAQENDLYTAASRASRDGNDALAIADLNNLLTRYPNSPLAQNARVDRFRSLNRSGRAQEAVAQARRYLADYPNGFARDEAKALVLQSLASP